MRNIKTVVAYVGTGYAGWQIQPQRETIQGVIEDRLSRMLKENVRIAGAGRTDAGVHARGQVANFPTTRQIPLEGLRRGLNARLPESIRILQVEEVPEQFQARADALAKEYCYRIARGGVVSPFEAPFVLPIRGALDIDRMQDAASRFEGRHDFQSLCPASCDLEDKRRTIMFSRLREDGEFLEYRVRGDGFLRHMVRTIVGTLIQVGRGHRMAKAVDEILAARDRRAAGPCAPARGLVLERVIYRGSE